MSEAAVCCDSLFLILFFFSRIAVHLLCHENVNENELPLGRASQEFLEIPSKTAGKVIGHGGAMLLELQSQSQGKIQIGQSGQSGITPGYRQVRITGTQEAVTKAKEMVLFLVSNPMMEAQQALNLLIDEKFSGRSKWGSHTYPNLPNQGVNMSPSDFPSQYQRSVPFYGDHQGQPLGYAASQQAAGLPAHWVPYSSSSGVAQYQSSAPIYGDYQGQPVDYAASQQAVRPPRHQQPYSSHSGGAQHQLSAPIYGDYQGQPADYAASQQAAGLPAHRVPYSPGSGGGSPLNTVFIVFVPKQFLGQIIGEKGKTISDLERRSGCNIQIDDDDVPGQDREITLQGSRQSIEAAKQMIQEIIEFSRRQSYYPHHRSDYDQGGAGGDRQQHQRQQQPSQGWAAAPSAWKKAATTPDGFVYYYNEKTGETRWDKPRGMP